MGAERVYFGLAHMSMSCFFFLSAALGQWYPLKWHNVLVFILCLFAALLAFLAGLSFRLRIPVLLSVELLCLVVIIHHMKASFVQPFHIWIHTEEGMQMLILLGIVLELIFIAYTQKDLDKAEPQSIYEILGGEDEEEQQLNAEDGALDTQSRTATEEEKTK